LGILFLLRQTSEFRVPDDAAIVLNRDGKTPVHEVLHLVYRQISRKALNRGITSGRMGDDAEPSHAPDNSHSRGSPPRLSMAFIST